MTGVVVWITGLPSSGKSTLGERARELLRTRGVACCLLDGDELRGAIHPRPGYGAAERADFYRTLAELAALLARQDLVVVVAATAHLRAFRDAARAAAPRFLEVFVDADPGTARERDAKGLYAAERAGAARDLPGAGVAFERPEAPDIVARGGLDEEALEQIVTRAGQASRRG